MPEFVAELIGKLRPGALANIDDDPGQGATVRV
jgi:hypothetical protein